jgi:peroxiredoxin
MGFPLGLGLAAALIVLLGVRLIDLRAALAEARRRVLLPHRGYVLPTIAATTITGDTITIGAVRDSGARQLILVLTTTCPHCRATLPTWRALVDSAKRNASSRVAVVGVSLDSLRPTLEYANAHGVDYPVVSLTDWKLGQLLKARMVPQTLVVDHRGVVLFAHAGRLGNGPALDSVYTALLGPPVRSMPAAGGGR